MAEELIGYYSDLTQPIVPITSAGVESANGNSTPFLVDTGVNVDLIVPIAVAKRLRWQISSNVTTVNMADGSKAEAIFAYPYIRWQGALRQCAALALVPPSSNESRTVKKPLKQAYEGFVGMGLLKGSVIELAMSIVRITKGAG